MKLLTTTLAAACALTSGMATAGQGDIDTTFGINGYTKIDVLQPFGAEYTHIDRATMIKGPNERLYVVGSVIKSDVLHWFPAVTRLMSNGAVDTTFNGGIASFDFGPNTWFLPRSAARATDGGIVLAGEWASLDNQTARPGVCKLSIDGVLDTGFGDEQGPKPGCRRFDSFSSAPLIETGIPTISVARTSDGGYVVAMANEVGVNDWHGAIARLNSAGDVDTTFGVNGYAIIADGSGAFYPHQIATRPNGSILVSGSFRTGPQNYSVVVADLDPQGMFYDAEVITIDNLNPQQPYAVPWALTVRPNGEVVVAGEAQTMDAGGRAAFIVRLDEELNPIVPAGAQFPNALFDMNRRAFKVADGCLKQRVTSLSSLSDGGLLIAGDYKCDSDGELFAIRLNADWALDTNFGTNGQTSVSFNSFGGDNLDDVIPTVVLQDSGDAVIAGMHGIDIFYGDDVYGVTRLNTGECDIFCDNFEDDD